MPPADRLGGKIVPNANNAAADLRPHGEHHIRRNPSLPFANRTMTDRHRATPEQWGSIEKCLAENKIPWATAACLLELRAPVEALEKARPQAWEAPPSIEPLLPRSELVTRIIEATKREPYGTAGVRAVIHAVADWLDERDTSIQSDPDCLEAPFADDAIRWLREEAEK